MRIKRFEASNVQEAMAAIRKEMGPEAVILSTREEKRHDACRVVVTAAIDRDVGSRAAGRGETVFGDLEAQDDFHFFSEKLRKEEVFSGAEEVQVRSILLGLKRIIDETLERRNRAPIQNACDIWVRKLMERGIERAIACLMIGKIKRRMKDEQKTQLDFGYIHGVLTRMFRVTGDLFKVEGSIPKFIVFLGPPGVGKTTTLAKMAARLKRKTKRRIVLLNTDVYRIGALDQLQIYGNLMGLPVETVYSKKDFTRVLASYSDETIFLVDTTGRSHVDDRGLMEIKISLDTMRKRTQAFLLLDAGRKREDLLDELEGFSLFSYQSLIWTKVDETRMPGEMLNICLRTGIPVSYITTGQNVPGDMELASPELLAETVLTEKNPRSCLWTKRQNFAFLPNA